MIDNDTRHASRGQNFAVTFKSWAMVALILIFVLLYAAALFGWLKPFTDTTILRRLEPIIFVIIGYFFGRLPALQTEKTLNSEIERQTNKADAAQHAKERAQQRQEVLEERVKNVKAALRANSFDIMSGILPENGGHSRILAKSASTQSSIGTALKILDS